MSEEPSRKKLSPAGGADSEAKYQSLFENSRDAIMTAEPPSGRFTSGNQAALKLFGAKNQEEFASHGPRDLSPERQPDGRNSAEKAGEMIETALREGSHFFEWTHRRISGEEFPADVLLTRMELDGKVIILATVRDITERKRAEEQLRLQSAALEAAANGIVITDSHGIILWVNPAFSSQTGWSPEEVVGKTPRILKSGKHDAVFYRGLWGTITAGRVWRGELINRHKDGRLYTKEMMITPVRNEQGEITNFIAINQDVTARKHLERALALSEQQLNSFFTGATAGLALFDKDLRYVRINETLAAMNGRSVTDHLGRTVREVLPKLAAAVEPTLQNVLTTGEPVPHFELAGETPSQPGIRRQWLESFFPITGKDGRVEGVGAIVVEVTQQRAAEAALRVRDRAFDTSVSALATSDLLGNLTYVNAAYVKMFGYASAAEMLGKPFARLFADPAAVESSVRTVQEQGHWTGELKARRTDGTSLDVLVSASVATDDAGQPLCMVASLVDITERKKIEKSLRSSEANLAEAQRVARMGSWSLDTATGAVTWSEELYRIFGIEVTDFGSTYEAFVNRVHPEDRDLVLRTNAAARAQGKSFNLEYRIVLPSGELKTIYEIGYAATDSTGKITRLFGTAQDITERKQAEKALQETNRRLEDALAKIEAAQQQAIQQENLRALGIMASGIAHDFNNSLTAIIGGSELLLSRPEYLDDKDKTRSYVEMMNTAAQDAGHVVNRLREFYRHREEHEVFVPANINELVVQAIALTQPKWKAEAEARSAPVNVHTDLQEVPLIAGNDGNLRELLTNLIFNAVDAMPRGGAITIRTYRDDGHVVLEVADTGSGMTEEVRRRCLEPFFTTKGKAGTGLGLSMVYGIIQRHQGTIDIETEPGKGTTFIIRLPVQTAPPRPEPTAQPVDLVQPLRVLVVDDEAVVRKIVGEYLKLDGHTVEAVNSGRDGLEKFRNSRFDLVLLDRAMPDMSGDEVAAAIKTANPTMPVVMLTGFGSMMDAADEKPAGVDFIVGKPVTINALRAAVSKAVASVN